MYDYRRLLPRVDEERSVIQEDEKDEDLFKLRKIIAADDQNINIEVLKSDFAELEISKKVEFAHNGQQVIDIVRNTFELHKEDM